MPFDSTQTPRAPGDIRLWSFGRRFWRHGRAIYFNDGNGPTHQLTRRQAKRIRDHLWRTACKINRQPLRAEVCRWWSDLTTALQELADMTSAEPVSNHGREG